MNATLINTPLLMPTMGISRYPDGWEEGLNSDEFLMATKQMFRKKFNDRN